MPKAPSPDRRDVKVDAALAAAVRQLEAALKEQEQAVSRIIGLVELLLAKAPDRVTRARLDGILEACAFQDVTGQRITKVMRFLRYLSKEVHVAVPTPSRDEATPPQDKPTSGLSQDQVDRLLKGETL